MATLLDAHPAICVHSQKEPCDFLEVKGRERLSGYAVSDATRWVVDFTTTYGLHGNRDRFFSALRGAGIAPEQARFILCIREPTDLARSYLRHIIERRSPREGMRIDAVRAEILSACDFDGAIACLEREAGPEAVFVVRFEDISGEAAQRRLAGQLQEWLGVYPQQNASPVWANAGGSVGRYPAALDRLAGVFRRTDLARRMSPHARARIRQVLSLAPSQAAMPPEMVEQTLTWLEAQESVLRSRTVLSQLTTGPLIASQEAAPWSQKT